MKDTIAELSTLCGQARTDAFDFCCSLIACESPPGHEAAAARLVTGEMRKLGYDDIITDSLGNVVGIIHGQTGSGAVLLTSHLDCYRNPQSTSQSSGPTKAGDDAGRLVVESASDAKAGLVAQLYAGACLTRLPARPSYSVVVAGCVAELGGLGIGIRHLLATTLPAAGIRPSIALIGNPTSLNLRLGHDGWIRLVIRLDGTNRSEVRRTINGLTRVLRKKQEHGYLSDKSEFVRVDKPLLKNYADIWRGSIGVERRLYPSDSVPKVIDHLRSSVRSIIGSCGNVWSEVAFDEARYQLADGETALVPSIVQPWSTDTGDSRVLAITQLLESAGCTFTTGLWDLHRLRTGTAGSVLSGQFGITTIGYGPGSEASQVGSDESIPSWKMTAAIFGNAVMANAIAGPDHLRSIPKDGRKIEPYPH